MHSEVDCGLSIGDERWVLSLVRLDKGSRPEHAILILEGFELDERNIWFIDLVVDKKKSFSEAMGVLRGTSKIRIFSPSSTPEPRRLLFSCPLELMKMTADTRIKSKSWNISADQGRQFLADVESDQKNPPAFHLMGKGNMTTTASSCENGHNCFSWAKEKLRRIGDQRLVIKEDLVDTFFVHITSRTLCEDVMHTTSYTTPILGAICAAVVAFFIYIFGSKMTLWFKC